MWFKLGIWFVGPTKFCTWCLLRRNILPSIFYKELNRCNTQTWSLFKVIFVKVDSYCLPIQNNFPYESCRIWTHHSAKSLNKGPVFRAKYTCLQNWDALRMKYTKRILFVIASCPRPPREQKSDVPSTGV